MGENMGNVMISSFKNTEEIQPEWLIDSQQRFILDLSRKVSHNQYLKHVQGELAEESLTEIPISILETVNFYTTVDLSYNSISKIAPNLALQMPHLTHLNFSHNSLKEIPQSIALLFHLEELLLRGNKITHLPNEIGLLYNLQMLDVSHNLLSKLPDELGNLQNLLRLNVSHNALKALPLSLGSCPNLSILLATFNQLVEPPQNVCNDSEELLSYLRNRTPPVLAEELLNYFPRIRSNVAHSELEDSARTEYVKIQTQTSKPASRTKTPMLLPANATLCSQQTLSDKIIGLIYGAVLGDSLGVATEYLTFGEIDFYYAGGRLNYHSFVQDEHRAHFHQGRTTCVSDFILLIIESVIQWSGVLDELELARRFIEYSNQGLIKELNAKPLITSTVINQLLANNLFATDPHSVALETARRLNSAVCEDLHALPMAVVSAMPQFYNLDEVKSNARRVCQTTHAHPSVIKSTTTLAVIVAQILQGRHVDEIKDLLIAETSASNGVSENDQTGSVKDTSSRTDRLEDVMNSVFSCLDDTVDFETSLTRILFMGGESRIYGAVCGGVLGCISGYSHLPAHWLDGLHPSITIWLNNKLNLLLDMMDLP